MTVYSNIKYNAENQKLAIARLIFRKKIQIGENSPTNTTFYFFRLKLFSFFG